MRNLFLLSILAVSVFLISCSAKSTTPAAEQTNNETGVSQTQKQNIGSIIKGSLDEDGKIVITDINFEKGSIEVPEESEDSLKALADYLKENTSVTMNVMCYTGNDGTPAYCINLSKQRADNILEKFKEYGISEDRVNFSGEGWNPGTSDEEQGERLEVEIVH